MRLSCLWQCENWEIQTEQEWFGQTQAQESHDNGAPAEAQRSGFAGKRRSKGAGAVFAAGGNGA